MLTVYLYRNCSTCREAVKWLDSHGVEYETKPIRETPPTAAELKSALRLMHGDVRGLFNTSGMDYRAMKLAGKLPEMGEDEALGLLAANGNLVRRPFAIGPGVALAGFKPEQWSEALS